ncbi:MAG: cell division protein FtsZ, partial [Acidobacteriota bacterium]
MEGQAGLFGNRRNRFTLEDHPDVTARAIAIGIGGIGCKTVRRMVEARIQGVELAAVDTDIRELRHSNAPITLEIGVPLTQGLGCCGNPQLGRRAALDEVERILDLIKGFDMVFVIGGEGGGTFTGAAPIFAGLACEVGAIAVAAATMPFSLQGLTRRRLAEVGIRELKEAANAVIAVPNEDSHRTPDDGVLRGDTVSHTEDLFCRTVRDLAEIVTKPGILKVEFCDLQAVMQKRKVILIGTGISEGPNRAAEAV